MNEYLLSDKVYLACKWLGLIFMPALAALIGAVGPAWGLPKVDAIVLTINALGTFIGALIGVSQLKAQTKAGR